MPGILVVEDDENLNRGITFEVPALVSDFRGHAGNWFARRRSHWSALVRCGF